MALLYNKGKRSWDIKISKDKSLKLEVGKSMTMPDEVAEKYVGLYPREFEIMSGERGKSVKEQIAKIAELDEKEKALAEKEKDIEEREKALAEKEKALEEKTAKKTAKKKKETEPEEE